jgi:MFS superfamily sulfate permease-like transporter
MLAGIGLVILLKQIPHALGNDQNILWDTSFRQHDAHNTFTEMLSSFGSFSPGAALISSVSLVLLAVWERPRFRRLPGFTALPAPLACVVVGTLLNEGFKAFRPEWELTALRHQLVELPTLENLAAFAQVVHLPDFTRIADPQVWKTALTLAVVASVEALLCLEAVDKLDPEKRISDPNTELRAQGLGNVVSALLGGLPVTAVIVRSSVNTYAGARTRLSSMVHGFLLLLAALLVPRWLNHIPLACLAAILLTVGYRLCSVNLFRSVWRGGWTQSVPFLVTVAMIVFTDLLKGILIGLAVSIFVVMRAYTRTAVTRVQDGEDVLIRFNKDLTFVNKPDLKARLREVPDGARLIIDGSRAHYVDHDAIETLREFEESASYRGIRIEYHHVLGRDRI